MTRDAIELLTDDHRTVEGLFADFATRAAEARQGLVERILGELSMHTALEEAVLYPAIRKDVPEGDPLVDHSIHEHHEIRSALARVDDVVDMAHTRDCERRVLRLREVVDHHVRTEEASVFPAMRRALPQSRLDELAARMRAARGIAPTHPHPAAPGGARAGEIAGSRAAG